MGHWFLSFLSNIFCLDVMTKIHWIEENHILLNEHHSQDKNLWCDYWDGIISLIWLLRASRSLPMYTDSLDVPRSCRSRVGREKQLMVGVGLFLLIMSGPIKIVTWQVNIDTGQVKLPLDMLKLPLDKLKLPPEKLMLKLDKLTCPLNILLSPNNLTLTYKISCLDKLTLSSVELILPLDK